MIAINYQKKRNLAYKRKNLIKKELSHKALSKVAFCDLFFICLPERFALLRGIELVTLYIYLRTRFGYAELAINQKYRFGTLGIPSRFAMVFYFFRKR